MENLRSEDWAAQFDYFCKQVIRNEAKDFFKSQSRRRFHEISLEHLREDEICKLASCDYYCFEENCLSVCGQIVYLENDLLVAALLTLAERERNVILLFYIFGETDQRISVYLNYARSTIQYIRTKAIMRLQRYMGAV